MSTASAQSWNDLIMSPTMDPRGLVANTTLQDSGGIARTGNFVRSTNWLQAATWISPVIAITPSATTAAFIQANNGQDFSSIEQVNLWNSTHAMTSINPQLPLCMEGLVYLRGSTSFTNFLPLDFLSGMVNSTSVQLSFRDNSLSGGDFTAGSTPTIPVYDFGSFTFGGTSHFLALTLLKTGRFSMGIRVLDNNGKFSMFPMEWIVV